MTTAAIGTARRKRGAGGAVGPGLTKPQANDGVFALKLWERRRVRAKGSHIRGVGYIGMALYEFFARQHRVVADLSYEEIAQKLGFARSSIVEAAERLQRHGWIDWLRRWEPSPERDGQVEQIRNAFWALIPAAALKRMGVSTRNPVPDDAKHEAGLKARFLAQCEAVDNGLDAALSRLGVAVAGRAANKETG